MSTRLGFSCAVLATVLSVGVASCTGFPGSAPAERQADVNGVRLPYVEEGRGVPVVLVHGSIADHRTWERQRALLARDYRVVAYSQRYFGPGPWQPGGPKIGVPQQSQDLVAFIRSLGSGPVHLVGWSSGGTVVLNVALQHPEMVRSAFVYEPPLASVITTEQDRKAVAEDRATAFGPAVDALKGGDNEKALRLVLDAVDGRGGTLERWPPSVRAVALDNARTLPLEFFESEPAPAITCAQLGQLQPVTAVARGEHTRVSYRLMAEATATCIGDGQYLVVPGARHLWPADEPQAFSQAVLSFLQRQP